MNSALVMTHDAIVGPWNPPYSPPALTPPQIGTTDTDLRYLQAGTRAIIFDAELSAPFRITGSNGSATLRVGTKSFKIVRPSNDFLKFQLPFLRAYADLRSDRIAEINVQTGDLLSFYGSIGFLNASRRRKTLELLNAVQRLAIRLEMQIKHYCRAPRPIDFSPQVQPMIQTPDHSTFPSGHATEAFILATVMNRLIFGTSTAKGIADKAMPFRLAQRIAANRTVAGVHFPVDSAAGAQMGCFIGNVVLALCNASLGNDFSSYTFEVNENLQTHVAPVNGQQVDVLDPAQAGDTGMYPTDDFSLDWMADAQYADALKAFDTSSKAVLSRLWKEAAAEWPS
ncbi:hypothetical protein KIN_07440 [Litoreibacter roseus]|uniref:Phosphatidic acid phosphatase type 2/haloperoxidase domain-containing protein n=2 Tax=Litoreibacter roseus TaxID=2601869 RepID=A0A6N6JCW6_9RHOB|nr:hypothetical protein KIN_07440 [Litoreibacter roseus]